MMYRDDAYIVRIPLRQFPKGSVQQDLRGPKIDSNELENHPR
jgi:hypothetical protein